jgi:low affinity Fe/Cu permease
MMRKDKKSIAKGKSKRMLRKQIKSMLGGAFLVTFILVLAWSLLLHWTRWACNSCTSVSFSFSCCVVLLGHVAVADAVDVVLDGDVDITLVSLDLESTVGA